MSELAQRRVRDFQQRCGETALHLAYHAALPVALNADLLHFLRINFFLDSAEPLPYTIEFELLLSPLCREIDQGLYEIEPEIRDILLTELAQEYDEERIRDVATLLWQYVDRFSAWSDRVELERAQQLTALNFLNSEKAQQWLSDIEVNVNQGDAVEREWFIAVQEEIEHQAQVCQTYPNLVNIAAKSLDVSIQSLKSQLDYLSTVPSERPREVLTAQIELLNQFQIEITSCRIIADWLNQQAEELVEELSNYALEAYPHVQETLTAQTLKAFRLSLKQWLQRLRHCLIWGRIDTLVDPTTPIVLDQEVYATAFNYLKSLLFAHSPTTQNEQFTTEHNEQLPTEGIEQLEKYVDYLIERLPTYRNISIE